MSEVFEAIVCRLPKDDVAFRLPSHVRVVVAEMDSETSALFAEDASRGFDEGFPALASELSVLFGQTLLVQYDGRTGYRASELYESGTLTKAFGEADEVWVEEDDDGNPMPGEPTHRFDEVPDDEDALYGTHPSAIELGLHALGYKGDRRRLHDIIYEI
jgi:hypothetical protein